MGEWSRLGDYAGQACLKLRWLNKRRPLWAKLAEVHGGREGGKQEAQSESWGYKMLLALGVLCPQVRDRMRTSHSCRGS